MSFCSFCLWAFSLTNESTDRPTPPFPQQVLKVDEEARTVTVQPGVKVGDLCEYLIANHGLTLENLASIAEQKPQVVFAPHVETSSGMILPDGYLRAVSDAVHAVGRRSLTAEPGARRQ